MTETHIRTMERKDLPNVLIIEQASYSHPWTQGMFSDCFRSGYDCYVMEQQGTLIGHGLMSSHADEAHILNICIRTSAQRTGHGKQFLRYMLDVLQKKQVCSVFLEVRESNKAAIHLYNGCGFNEIATRKGYYPTEYGREDALIFAKELAFSNKMQPL